MGAHHAHSHGHNHGHNRGDHQSSDEAAMADTLDLDAVLLQDHQDEVLALAAGHHPAPAAILDLGAGTGTGTLALAHKFPHAKVLAVDYSEFMLERLTATVTSEHLDGRVSAQQVDLDSAWPDLSATGGSVDLVWTALAMHHMSYPDAVFGEIARSLAPGGVLIVIEMEGWPQYLPEDLGLGEPGFEQRCHAAVADAPWNAYPDWSTAIELSGLTMVEQRVFDYVGQGRAVAHQQKLIAQAAQGFLAKVRSSWAVARDENDPGEQELTLSASDLALLDELIDPDSPQFLGNRADLTVRAKRRVWVARKD